MDELAMAVTEALCVLVETQDKKTAKEVIEGKFPNRHVIRALNKDDFKISWLDRIDPRNVLKGVDYVKTTREDSPRKLKLEKRRYKYTVDVRAAHRIPIPGRQEKFLIQKFINPTRLAIAEHYTTSQIKLFSRSNEDGEDVRDFSSVATRLPKKFRRDYDTFLRLSKELVPTFIKKINPMEFFLPSESPTVSSDSSTATLFSPFYKYTLQFVNQQDGYIEIGTMCSWGFGLEIGPYFILKVSGGPQELRDYLQRLYS